MCVSRCQRESRAFSPAGPNSSRLYWSPDLQWGRAPTEYGERSNLGRSRDLIFRMKTCAEQRANLQLVVGKPFKPERSAVNPEKEGESP